MVGDWHGRIIPADAGNTALFDSLDEIHQDHPRGCGEHRIDVYGEGFATGSSPRMRGTLIGSAMMASGHGIIPADAGNTGSLPATVT